MKNKLLPIITVSLFLVVVFLVAARMYKKQDLEKKTFLAQENSKLFVPDHAPSLGPENAKVVVTEFLDPECESCRAVYPAVKEIMKEHEGKIRLVVRYAPFHHNSDFAIRILESARRQGKYWETLELLFEKQPEWGSHHAPKPELIWTYLPQVELDVERIRQELNDPVFTNIIAKDLEDGRALGVTGTPTFFVNGKPLEDFGLEFLKAAIERELNSDS